MHVIPEWFYREFSGFSPISIFFLTNNPNYGSIDSIECAWAVFKEPKWHLKPYKLEVINCDLKGDKDESSYSDGGD